MEKGHRLQPGTEYRGLRDADARTFSPLTASHTRPRGGSPIGSGHGLIIATDSDASAMWSINEQGGKGDPADVVLRRVLDAGHLVETTREFIGWASVSVTDLVDGRPGAGAPPSCNARSLTFAVMSAASSPDCGDPSVESMTNFAHRERC